MLGETTNIKGVLADFLTPILPNIRGEPIREGIIELHQFISGNVASMSSNLGGVQHSHLALAMTSESYAAQMVSASVPSHNSGDYLLTMGNTQDQALETEKFKQNQALFL